MINRLEATRYLVEQLSDEPIIASCGNPKFDLFTAADVQMSFPLEAAEVRIDLARNYPHVDRFLQTVRERPAYKAALDRGGHYELLGG